jgi:protein O-mannosyl-transferase
MLLIALASIAYQRNEIWTTKLSLWTDVARKTPNKSRVRNSMGNCYALLGRHFEAITEYEIALKLDPQNTEVYYNLGVNYEIVGILNRAFYYYDAFCSLAPADHQEAVMRACERAGHFKRTVHAVP